MEKLMQAIFQARRCGVEQPISFTQTEEDWPVTPRTSRTKSIWIRRTYQMKRSARREDAIVAILSVAKPSGNVLSQEIQKADSATTTRLPINYDIQEPGCRVGMGAFPLYKHIYRERILDS
jgi:hypothetical protein